MEIKPTIRRSLTDRKTVLTRNVESLRVLLAASEAEDAIKRNDIAASEAEIADIDDLLGAPTRGVAPFIPQR